MDPVTALFVGAAVFFTYVVLSAELRATYTSYRMPLPQWIRIQPPPPSRRFMWPNVLLVAVIVGLGNAYMLRISTDGSNPVLTRTFALIELVLAAVWSWA